MTGAHAESTRQRVAIVSGGNRGIGYEICRELAQLGFRVMLTARVAAKGKAACKTLREDGLCVEYHQLDVTRARSIDALATFVKKRFGRADILVNNAGIMIDPRGERFVNSDLKTYHATFETNVLGPLALTQALLPLMRERGYGRIVNLSSGLGQLAEMDAGTPAYRLSKTALNALTRIVAAETRGANILVNSMCPGWVRTDMGGPNAPRSVARGAATAVWLATLPDHGPTGRFFRDRRALAW